MRTLERAVSTSGRRWTHAPMLLLTTLAVACGDATGPSGADADTLPPTLENIVGAYAATIFTGGGFDVLALGGGLEMTLAIDGSVTGTMEIPAAAGGPFTADMAGTYSVTGNSLTFTQDADTFVRDMTWTWTNGVLNGSWGGGAAGTTVTVRMER